ncbi:MAG: glutaredoxin 3 [Gammaproteobacteria bacterium]|jgi:glutaredoxin 3|nr:glutaredoxin 3 [Gammaproteobacteria bacterium]
MTQPSIVMYMTGWCPYCQRAGALLTQKKLAFDQINVDDDAKSRQEMTRRSGRRSVPQIFIGEKHIGGCDDLFALDGSGELDRLLQGA